MSYKTVDRIDRLADKQLAQLETEENGSTDRAPKGFPARFLA